MTDRMWLIGLTLSLLSLTAFGCATPYTYYGGDRCHAISVSGRYVDGASCTDCDAECDSETFVPTFEEGTLTNHIVRGIRCGGGCGEMYWGEWTYDPPDACDPCNNHGDWTGEQCCCRPSAWARFWNGLHGQRIGDGCQAPGGDCPDCTARDWEPDQILMEPSGPMDPAMPIDEPETIFETQSTEMHPHLADRTTSQHPYSRLKRRTTH